MTPKQRIYLMADLWPAACATQGWPPNDRALRITEVSRALGRAVASASEIKSNDDFDRVKKHLLMLADNVRAAGESEHEGRARRLRHEIGGVIVELENVRGPGFDALGYVRALCADIANGGVSPRVEVCDVEDLSAAPRGDKRSELDQLLVTLTARLLQAREQVAAETAGPLVPQLEAESVSQPF